MKSIDLNDDGIDWQKQVEEQRQVIEGLQKQIALEKHNDMSIVSEEVHSPSAMNTERSLVPNIQSTEKNRQLKSEIAALQE